MRVASEPFRVRRALLSVFDKTGLIELAQALHAAGIELVSTGSTAARIAEAGLPVTSVAEVTGFPECLAGRVKTLHPRIHAGILADRRSVDQTQELADLGIQAFELVVVNLYPFRETVAAGNGFDDCVEQIDIGGPTMIRAAAKNHPGVAVVTSPSQYPQVIAAVEGDGFTPDSLRSLALAAFRHTASYDVAIATWLASQTEETKHTEWLGGTWVKTQDLRYGENPHQSAALYLSQGEPAGLAGAQLLQGKPMSYNNYVDADAAYRAAYDFGSPCVAIIKHANPCGIAVANDIAEAHRRAHACDPLSAFGGVIACNRSVTKELAEGVRDIFTEVIVAPGFEPEAVTILTAKPSLRLLQAPAYPQETSNWRPITGGLLTQAVDRLDAAGDDVANWELAAGDPVDEARLRDLEFAWRACRAVKSNAILLARDQASVGIGMGQVNRVDSCQLAVSRAGARAAGSVAASDAFFPFADGPQILLAAGITAIVQPGGSKRDADTIAACQAAGVSLYLTRTRHFFH